MTSRIRKFIQDSIENIYTGLGGSLDRITGLRFSEESWMAEEELEAIYHSDSTAQRIVTELVDCAFRNGWSLAYDGDEDPDVLKDQEKAIKELLDGDEASKGLKATASLIDAIYWGRLYGRGGLYMGVEDGRSQAMPLDMERARTLVFVETLDSRDFWPVSYYSDPGQPRYGEPEIYKIQRQGGMSSAEHTEVHESRIIVFDSSIPTAKKKLLEENWRWQPLLQPLYDDLRGYITAKQSLAHLVTDLSTGVLKIDELYDVLSQEDLSAFNTRMKILDMGRGIRVMPIDTKEDFSYQSRTLTGLGDVIDRIQSFLASGSKYSQVILFGKGSPGLANEEISSDRYWNGRVKAERRPWEADLTRLVRLAAITVGARDPMSWSAKMSDLWERTPQEETEYKKGTADVDKIYIDAQVLTPEEIAIKRFGGAEFDDGPPQIDVEMRQAMLEADIERAKNPPEPPAFGPAAEDDEESVDDPDEEGEDEDDQEGSP